MIPKISLGAYIFQRPFLSGLSTEGNWASLIVESKFTVFVEFYFSFVVNFPSTSPLGAYIWRDDFTGFFALPVRGGGETYIWRGLYMEGHIFGILRYSSSPNGLWVNWVSLLTQRNNCFSKIQLVGQKYWDKTILVGKTRFSHCFGFQSRRFSLLVGYNI